MKPRRVFQRETVQPGTTRNLLLVGVFLCFGLVVSGFLISYEDASAWGALGLPALLFIVTAPFLLRSRLAQQHDLGALLCAALVAKFIGSFGHYFVAYDVYDGITDTRLYLREGASIVEAFRLGEISLGDLIPTSRGTPFISEVSGIIQVLIGSDPLAVFMFSAWLAFFGLLAFVYAAERAVPGLIVRRYAALILFLPTLVFWTGNISKDSLMILFIGVSAAGAARVFTRQASGFIYLALGVVGISYVRPHVALLVLGAFGVALVAGRRRSGSSPARTSIVTRGVGVAAIVFGFTFVVSQGTDVIPGFSEQGLDVDAALTYTERQSSIGGSEIDAARPNNVLAYPFAFVTVFFRPFPFEVTNFTQALAAAESLLLFALGIRWRRNLSSGVKRALKEPYLMMAGLYTLSFGFAWSAIGNLGIIVRQRSQAIAFLLLFLCVVAAVTDRKAAVSQSDDLRPVRSAR